MIANGFLVCFKCCNNFWFRIPEFPQIGLNAAARLCWILIKLELLIR